MKSEQKIKRTFWKKKKPNYKPLQDTKKKKLTFNNVEVEKCE